MSSKKKNTNNRHVASTVLGICAIAIVCLVVYLLGRTGVIRMDGSSGQASSRTESTSAGTVEKASSVTESAGAVSSAASSGTASETDTESLVTIITETPTEKPTPTPTKKPTPTPTETPTPEPVKEETMYTTDAVNVRAGASTDTEIVGKLFAGSSVTRTGEEGDWSIVDYDGQKAYIKTEFLAAEKTYTQVWELGDLDNEPVNFGYAQANIDENNVPTDWSWYESKWGQFNVDWIQDTSKNIIYLTMDEGFENDTTAGILDTLKAKEVKATFFLTKYFVDEMPEMVQRMIDEGHQLGNHTCTHPQMPTLSIEEQTDQIMTLQNLVKDQFGYDMKYFRYPEGVYSNQSLGLVNNLGLKVVFWSYAYNDYSDEQPPVEESLQAAVSAVHPGAVYLLHASSTTNAAFLGDFIDQCREKGFEFGIYPENAN